MIEALPDATPVTTPVAAFTVATAVLELLQVPLLLFPLIANVVVAPTHTDEAPVTLPAFGRPFIVILAEAVELPQLPLTLYVIVADPAATPVTTPVAGSTVAVALLLLLQLPLPVPLLVNAVVEPMQTVEFPLTVPAFGSAFTVIT